MRKYLNFLWMLATELFLFKWKTIEKQIKYYLSDYDIHNIEIMYAKHNFIPMFFTNIYIKKEKLQQPHPSQRHFPDILTS